VYGHFLIEMVWVHEHRRREGIGRRLMLEAERVAIARGCRAAQVDTLSFQGVEFYQALGFSPVGVIEDFPSGYSKHFFVRRYDGHDMNDPISADR
jgi:ribosomal protein S18 acetylase RimI-like enzyme